MQAVVGALRGIAIFCRQASALIALILAIRLLWLSARMGLEHAHARAVSAGTIVGSATTATPLPDKSFRPDTSPRGGLRPNLEDLKSLVGEPTVQPEPEPAPPTPVLRRILVDVGPPRSEVFIGKRNVGMTPYGGQIACTLEEEIQVQVLPPEGVPISRRVTCRGDTLLVRE